ncbi:matrixin family metalloprotease [Candidatus Auribacterota bacterium]
MKLKILSFVIMVILMFAAPGSIHAALDISFDYTYDTNSFFNTQAKRDVLDAAGNVFESRITDTLDSITPGGSNEWTTSFTHPGTGGNQNIVDPSISGGVIVVYVGGRSLGGSLGLGGYGGYSASGSQAWLDLIEGRGEAGAIANPPTDFACWGGSISFNSDSTWYFDSNVSTDDVPPGENDFYSVAIHELGHVLGYLYDSGNVNSWTNLVDTDTDKFTGTFSVAEYGGDVPLAGSDDSGRSHWEAELESTLPGTETSQEVSMDPTITVGERKYYTDLDFAGLQDIGWEVTAVPEPSLIFLFPLGIFFVFLHRRRSRNTSK